MKKTLFTLLLALFCFGLQAEPVGVETAHSLGLRFMQTKTGIRSAEASCVHTEFLVDGTPCFYVFAMQPKGFVIVAADDRMLPILGYSTESSFCQPDAENGLEVLFDAYCADLTQAKEKQMVQTQEIAELWQSIAASGSLAHRGTRSVGPLVTSTWHQTQLYNYQCPEDPEGYDGHVKVGCVANAMSQLMRYWEWPKTGTGSHSYYCYGYGSTSYGTLSANFGEADYRYELMPDFLDYTSRPDEIDAVALLEFHTGVSVEMDYGPNASGAYSGDVQYALSDYFRYANTMSYNDRDDYSDDQWIAMLKNEFDNGRPVYYSAYSPTKGGTRGGHAFICDGYDENDFMHFNWGWQGFDNGFYSINEMNLTHHGYNYNHYALINIHPNEEYYNQPKPVRNLEIIPSFYGMGYEMTLTAPMQTIGGSSLTSIDSIVLLMNGEWVHSFVAPQPGENLELVQFLDNEDCGVVNYFTIYPVASGGRGKELVDTVAMWTSYGGMSKPLKIQLHDAAGDGWLSPALSILDERGIVQHRVGLTEGYDAEITLQIPVSQELTLYWNYCNVGYENDDMECSFEVYDFKDSLLYAQIATPVVGELYSFYSDWNIVVAPDFIDAEYVYREDGTFGVQVSWGMSYVNQWMDYFVLERYTDINSYPSDAEWHLSPECFGYFDEIEPGTYYYRLRADYSAGGGIPSPSAYAPYLYDPSLDYAMVEVTSVNEQSVQTYAYPNPVSDMLHLESESRVEAYNALGECLYHGCTAIVDVSDWNSGVYFLRITTTSGGVLTQKIIKK